MLGDICEVDFRVTFELTFELTLHFQRTSINFANICQLTPCVTAPLHMGQKVPSLKVRSDDETFSSNKIKGKSLQLKVLLRHVFSKALLIVVKYINFCF